MSEVPLLTMLIRGMRDEFFRVNRGTSLIRNRLLLGPYSRPKPRAEEELRCRRVCDVGPGMRDAGRVFQGLQGYLAHKKPPPPRSLQ